MCRSSCGSCHRSNVVCCTRALILIVDFSHKHIIHLSPSTPHVYSPSTTYFSSQLASMILFVKRARTRSGRPRFSFSSPSLCILRQCHTQDTQLYFFVLCLYFLLLPHQRCDSTNNISITTSTKTKLLPMSQTTPALGRTILIFPVRRIGEYHSTLCFLTSSSMAIQRTTTSMAPCLSMMLCEGSLADRL